MDASRPRSVLDRSLAELDPDVAELIDAELARQRSTLEMIASENFAPLAVMQAQGSVLTNKYAEGYPGRRYYGGCEHVDRIEQLAIDRVRALFGAEAANVQPHSGAQANAAAMFAADIIAESLQPSLDDARADKLQRQVAGLAGRFPLYPTVPDVAR